MSLHSRKLLHTTDLRGELYHCLLYTSKNKGKFSFIHKKSVPNVPLVNTPYVMCRSTEILSYTTAATLPYGRRKTATRMLLHSLPNYGRADLKSRPL